MSFNNIENRVYHGHAYVCIYNFIGRYFYFCWKYVGQESSNWIWRIMYPYILRLIYNKIIKYLCASLYLAILNVSFLSSNHINFFWSIPPANNAIPGRRNLRIKRKPKPHCTFVFKMLSLNFYSSAISENINTPRETCIPGKN